MKMNGLIIKLAVNLGLLTLVVATVNFPWMYYLPYGETVTLRPLYQNDTQNVTVSVCKWYSPSNVLLNPDAITYDKNHYFIDKGTCELTIFEISKNDNGIYHCLVNDFFISKAMLNIHGAPKATTLEEYTPNLIAGFATAGGLIAFFAFTCALYRFRYSNRHKEKRPSSPRKDENGYKMKEVMTTTSMQNKAYEFDDMDSLHTIRF